MAIVSFFGGVGIALALCLILGGVYWYNSRPRPWKTEAIKAHFYRVSWHPVFNDSYRKAVSNNATGERAEKESEPSPPKGSMPLAGQMNVDLIFDLENDTAYDYTLQAPNSYGLVAMEKVGSKNSLVRVEFLKWSPEYSGVLRPINGDNQILIPAHQTVRVRFSNQYFMMDYADPKKRQDWENGEVGKQFVRDTLKDSDSFVIFDETSHYRIELPLKDALRQE